MPQEFSDRPLSQDTVSSKQKVFDTADLAGQRPSGSLAPQGTKVPRLKSSESKPRVDNDRRLDSLLPNCIVLCGITILITLCFFFFESLRFLAPAERARQIAPLIPALMALLFGPVGLWLLKNRSRK